jgi:hypothetical protein
MPSFFFLFFFFPQLRPSFASHACGSARCRAPVLLFWAICQFLHISPFLRVHATVVYTPCVHEVHQVVVHAIPCGIGSGTCHIAYRALLLLVCLPRLSIPLPLVSLALLSHCHILIELIIIVYYITLLFLFVIARHVCHGYTYMLGLGHLVGVLCQT